MQVACLHLLQVVDQNPVELGDKCLDSLKGPCDGLLRCCAVPSSGVVKGATNIDLRSPQLAY